MGPWKSRLCLRYSAPQLFIRFPDIIQFMELLEIARTEKQLDEFNRLEPAVAKGLTNIRPSPVFKPVQKGSELVNRKSIGTIAELDFNNLS